MSEKSDTPTLGKVLDGMAKVLEIALEHPLLTLEERTKLVEGVKDGMTGDPKSYAKKLRAVSDTSQARIKEEYPWLSVWKDVGTFDGTEN